MVHAGTDGLLYIPALTSYIDVEIPVYGLPASEAPLQTVEGMAARMVKMIRVVQPTGPYRVAGWSFGGTLAYEIWYGKACRLPLPDHSRGASIQVK